MGKNHRFSLHFADYIFQNIIFLLPYWYHNVFIYYLSGQYKNKIVTNNYKIFENGYLEKKLIWQNIKKRFLFIYIKTLHMTFDGRL